VQELGNLLLLLLPLSLHRPQAGCAVLHDSHQAPFCGLKCADLCVRSFLQLVRQLQQSLLL
jgi:hypothetical protein